MMTKQNYIKAAEIVNDAWGATAIVREWPTGKLTAVQSREVMKLVAMEMEDAFVQFFRGDNPRFDEGRFREVCRK